MFYIFFKKKCKVLRAESLSLNIRIGDDTIELTVPPPMLEKRDRFMKTIKFIGAESIDE